MRLDTKFGRVMACLGRRLQAVILMLTIYYLADTPRFFAAIDLAYLKP